MVGVKMMGGESSTGSNNCTLRFRGGLDITFFGGFFGPAIIYRGLRGSPSIAFCSYVIQYVALPSGGTMARYAAYFSWEVKDHQPMPIMGRAAAFARGPTPCLFCLFFFLDWLPKIATFYLVALQTRPWQLIALLHRGSHFIPTSLLCSGLGY